MSNLGRKLAVLAVLLGGVWFIYEHKSHTTADSQQYAPSKTSQAIDQDAVNKIQDATDALEAHNFAEAVKLALSVAKDERVSDDIRGTAFLLIGDVAIYLKHYDVATESFNYILKLPGATEQDKKEAKEDLEKLSKLSKDSEV